MLTKKRTTTRRDQKHENSTDNGEQTDDVVEVMITVFVVKDTMVNSGNDDIAADYSSAMMSSVLYVSPFSSDVT